MSFELSFGGELFSGILAATEPPVQKCFSPGKPCMPSRQLAQEKPHRFSLLLSGGVPPMRPPKDCSPPSSDFFRSQSSLQAHQTEAAPGSTSLETGTDLIKIFFMLFMYGFSSGPIKIIFIVITFGGFVTGKRFSDVIVKPGGVGDAGLRRASKDGVRVAPSCWGNLSGYDPMRRTDGEWNSKLARGDFDRHNTRTPYGKHILQHTQSARGDLAHSPQRTRCLYNVQIILPTSSAGRIIAVQSHRPIFMAGPLQATRRKDAGSGGSGKSQCVVKRAGVFLEPRDFSCDFFL
ncbi:hypothetical protein GEV33_011490 [Tenebrio molitor]|uniref:Uncharacterized protein n=1 Tax=Tenebrio molitor TaxID=7067 RepID=A0A8J6HBN4_TENMO|nr:hypothetical protein GEV33_011490 [Tenebrio molitor]